VADISDAYADRAHEALRTELLGAIQSAQDNAAGVDDSYYLTDALFSLADSLLSQITALVWRAEASETRAQTAYDAIDDLQARVAALEQLNPPEA
jgi:hypothetical protein